MMRTRPVRLFSWFVGIAVLAGMVWYYASEDFVGMAQGVGLDGIAAWVALTLAARVVQGETTVVPIRALGFRIRRLDVFWIGWIRTFANQILPLSGVAAYARAIRKNTQISWSELAAMATPQFVLAAAAVGVVGLVAVAANVGHQGGGLAILALVYSVIIGLSLAMTHGAARVIRLLPASLSGRARQTAGALTKLSATPGLVIRIVVYHAVAILIRGLRVWLIFEAAGASLSWYEALLVIAIAESTLLIQVTPGGLGLREGAILAGAALVGVATSVAVGVAVLDRLLVVAITVVLTPPSIAMLRFGNRSAS